MKHTIAAGLLSIIALAAPTIASADERLALQNSASAPVSVETSQSISFLRSPLQDVTQAFKTESVRFVNHATVPATDVAFQVVGNGRTRIVDDRGSFAPGITIARAISEFDGASYFASPETWTVVSVRYADGTSWTLKPAPSVANTK